jgi:glycosyltransferase involved in cell wall biosynthesis
VRILTVLTYYRPHTSGLTIYAERLARAFASRGHQVTVMTTRYDRSLPNEEVIDGIRIVRVPVALRISKGVIAPTFGLVATKLVAQHDLIHLHLPQFDAPGVALRGRLFGKPVVLTYHCDLLLPKGGLNRFVNHIVHFQNNLAGMLSDHLVTYTQDYADNSPYLSRYQKKLSALLPPVILPEPEPGGADAFARKYQTKARHPVIGMVTRFASEKGVEVLLDALPAIRAKYPGFQVLFAGQYRDVIGEQSYGARLMPIIKEYELQGSWTFLGNLSQKELAAFYPNLDVLVVPSLNSTEAFGLVQVEAMMNNVPCVASNLPGVRRPVQMHDMGMVVPIGDAQSLAAALLEIFEGKKKYSCDTEKLKQEYDPDTIAKGYELLFQQLQKRKKPAIH